MSQVILGIIITTVLISIKGFNDFNFFDRYKFQVSKILRGEKVRLLSSGFLHADWMHLGFNMYALYLFGDIVIVNLGIFSFIAIYVGSLLTGSLYTLFFHKKNPFYSAIGASGAVSGIVYSAILLYPEMSLMMFPLPIPIPGYIFGIGYLLYSIYGMKKQLGNIGHAAHLGGAIGGFSFTLILFPGIFFGNQLLVLALAVPIILVLAFGEKLRQ